MCNEKNLKATDFEFLQPVSTPLVKKTDNFNLEEIEKSAIAECIKKHAGNLTRAADELGLTRGALYRRIEKYGL
jgi:transcriptional regulator of acetoin/glycerol metabolism